MSSAIPGVQWVFQSGPATFTPTASFCQWLRAEGMRCGHCGAVRPEALPRLTEMVVSPVDPDQVIGMVLLGGLVLRTDLIQLIGAEKLERHCRLLPVRNEARVAYSDFRCLVERAPRGKYRGSSASRIGLCKECGRLLYWPIGERYLLRNYWEAGEDVTVLDNRLLCSREYYETVLAPGGFLKLTAEPTRLADLPEDGLPADFLHMVEEVRRRGWQR